MKRVICQFLFLILLVLHTSADARMVKEIVNVEGMRENILTGYGLVIGLEGTGDQTTQTPFATQSLQSMLQRLGVQLPPGVQLQTKNVAAVMVSATLPSLAQIGDKIDVSVSSLGNAKSLRGGQLIATPLKGLDGQVYAIAQGSLVIPQAGSNTLGIKQPPVLQNTGRVINGGLIEMAAPEFDFDDLITLTLKESSFENMDRLMAVINAKYPNSAKIISAKKIQIDAKSLGQNPVSLLASILKLNIDIDNKVPRITINSRTGSVVMNGQVKVSPTVISHGGLSIRVGDISEDKTNNQKTAFIEFKKDGNLSDLLALLTKANVVPQDLLAIIQVLKDSGAIEAELEVL